MFGGLAFMRRGHMCCGVVGEDLMLRLGEEGAAAVIDDEHVRPMDFTGRPLKTMVYVLRAGIGTKARLGRWVQRAVAFNDTLEPKKKAPNKKKPAKKKAAKKKR